LLTARNFLTDRKGGTSAKALSHLFVLQADTQQKTATKESSQVGKKGSPIIAPEEMSAKTVEASVEPTTEEEPAAMEDSAE
jgi:hypothetical protein